MLNALWVLVSLGKVAMDTRTNSSEVSHFVVSTSTSLSLAGVDKDTTPETCVTTHVVACYIFFLWKQNVKINWYLICPLRFYQFPLWHLGLQAYDKFFSRELSVCFLFSITSFYKGLLLLSVFMENPTPKTHEINFLRKN